MADDPTKVFRQRQLGRLKLAELREKIDRAEVILEAGDDPDLMEMCIEWVLSMHVTNDTSRLGLGFSDLDRRVGKARA